MALDGLDANVKLKGFPWHAQVSVMCVAGLSVRCWGGRVGVWVGGYGWALGSCSPGAAVACAGLSGGGC